MKNPKQTKVTKYLQRTFYFLHKNTQKCICLKAKNLPSSSTISSSNSSSSRSSCNIIQLIPIHLTPESRSAFDIFSFTDVYIFSWEKRTLETKGNKLKKTGTHEDVHIYLQLEVLWNRLHMWGPPRAQRWGACTLDCWNKPVWSPSLFLYVIHWIGKWTLTGRLTQPGRVVNKAWTC